MNRVAAGLLGVVCCVAIVMFVLESESDLGGFALAIGCLALGVPLLSYATGGKGLVSKFPRSLVAATRVYFAAAWIVLLLYSTYWAIHYGSLVLALYFAVFGFMWALLIFGVAVVPIWAGAHFGALAYGKFRAGRKGANASGV
jgi:hypothetical protein